MFSGIVSQTSKTLRRHRQRGGFLLVLPIPKGWKVGLGDSIAVDGICLTVEKIDNKTFSVFTMPETLGRTNIAKLTNDHLFNLERSLTLQNAIGGHLVSGHVDSTGSVVKLAKEGQSKRAKVFFDKKYANYLIERGSVTVNGVSLTVTAVGGDFFEVALNPYTLSKTNLGKLKVGDKVNIEFDSLAKYVAKMLPTF